MSGVVTSTTVLPPSCAYARWAGTYNKDVNPIVSLQERILPSLLPNVDGKTVLDLGCGTGRILDLWREQYPSRLLGLDFSREMLSQVRDVAVIEGDCCSLPIANSSVDVASCCLTLGYLPNLSAFAEEAARVLAPDGLLLLTELHPVTTNRFGWKRGFTSDDQSFAVRSHAIPIEEVLAAFASAGFTADLLLEPCFDAPERALFEAAHRLDDFERFRHAPAIYIARLRRTTPRIDVASSMSITNARIAWGGSVATTAEVHCNDDRISTIGNIVSAHHQILDLSGYLLLPGLINAHDHLEFALFPRLGRGGYRNSREWAEEIYRPEASPIREHLRVPKWVRLWWGGIRNLLAGVTTVCHHNPYDEAVFNDEFPVRVLRDYGWAHSPHFEPDVAGRHRSTPHDAPFLIHLAEGVDAASAEEIFLLESDNILGGRTVAIHGVGLDSRGLRLLEQRGAALAWCPSSNHFLFGRSLSLEQLSRISRLALGSDSPLTAAGDLLDEIRFARQLGASTECLYDIVTGGANRVLRLKCHEGLIAPSGVADFIAVRDHALCPADALATLSYSDVELVVCGGRVRLASDQLKDRCPPQLTQKLELLIIDGVRRWIAAPVSELLFHSREALGPNITMCGRALTQ